MEKKTVEIKKKKKEERREAVRDGEQVRKKREPGEPSDLM